MSVVTAVPVPIFGPNGYLIPSESEIQAGVIADWQSAIPGLNVPATPPTPGTASPPQSQRRDYRLRP